MSLRWGMAATLAAVASVATTVSLASIVGRGLTGAPISPVGASVAGLVLALVLALRAKRGEGPLARLAAWLPAGLDELRGARRVLAGLLMVLAIVQVARLSCFVADDQHTWGAAFPPVEKGVRHCCQASYLQAAELARRGDENVYAAEHYPMFSDVPMGEGAVPDHPVALLERYIDDPYEYPPPFLVVPRLALAVSHDFMVHRAAWFLLQVLSLLAATLLVARAVDEEDRPAATLLSLLVFASLPGLFTLQFGQWHMAAIVLALGAMEAERRDRSALAGALLAAAIVTKIFPGVLGVVWLARRRWSAAAWCLAFSAVFTGASWLVLGSEPFVAFLDYQLPRIANGEAFSFAIKEDLVIASNFGIWGIPYKLTRLGLLASAQPLANRLTWIYGFVLLALAAYAARRDRSAGGEPALWLALLILASLRSPVAPHVYTAAPAMWLLTLQARRWSATRLGLVAVVLAFATMGGLPPLPSPEATIVAWSSGQVAMLAVGMATLWVPRPAS